MKIIGAPVDDFDTLFVAYISREERKALSDLILALRGASDDKDYRGLVGLRDIWDPDYRDAFDFIRSEADRRFAENKAAKEVINETD
jgi:hypothetical protein